MNTSDTGSEVVSGHDFRNGTRGSQKQKYFLNIAGEFFVAGELNRRGVFASVTYGAAKNADVLVVDPDSQQTAVIEVKTTSSSNNKWLTGAHSLDENNIRPHLFWVLTLLPDITEANCAPRYFVLSSRELIENVSERHQEYAAAYHATNGVPFQVQGSQAVYSLRLEDVEAMQCEGQWSKITDWLARK